MTTDRRLSERDYDVRARLLPEAFRDVVIKKNGDFLPTILVDGVVAGLWAVAVTKGEAVLTISSFTKVVAGARTELESEAERLVRLVEPEATSHAAAWA